jgi:serine-type D-Ala-D-Ala carboxypeptidase (penicillin-binding protein 5/6)
MILPVHRHLFTPIFLREMDKSMKQRTLLMIVLVLMVVLVVVMGIFFSSVLSFGGDTSASVATSTPTDVPPPTDTPSPSPTTFPSPTPPPLVNGSSAYLLDATTGRVLLDVKSHLRVAMWSTTKIMTALLAIERLPPDQIVTIRQAELDEVPNGMSVAQLHANDQMSVRHLLYGLLLPSGSDAAIVLAHTVSGNTANFVAFMNARAAQLGLRDTHYTNSYGADDPNHYSSAADLVKLARVALGYPLFAQIVSTPSYHLDPNLSHVRYDWQNILDAFLQSYPGANGVKTGSNAAETDWCMVFSASRHGYLLIGAEMQAPSEDQIFTDAENILTKGFDS